MFLWQNCSGKGLIKTRTAHPSQVQLSLSTFYYSFRCSTGPSDVLLVIQTFFYSSCYFTLIDSTWLLVKMEFPYRVILLLGSKILRIRKCLKIFFHSSRPNIQHTLKLRVNQRLPVGSLLITVIFTTHFKFSYYRNIVQSVGLCCFRSDRRCEVQHLSVCCDYCRRQWSIISWDLL